MLAIHFFFVRTNNNFEIPFLRELFEVLSAVQELGQELSPPTRAGDAR